MTSTTDSTNDGDRGAVSQVIDALEEATGGGDTTVGHILETLEERSVGVLLAALGLLTAMPFIGGLPGAPIVLALLILIAVANTAFGSGSARPPAAIREREVSAERLSRGIEWARPKAEWLDGLFKPRLGFLIEGRAQRIIVLGIVAALAGLMPLLGLVPFGVLVPALGVMLLGLALMARDGLFALAGYIFAALTVMGLFAAV